MYQSRIWFPWQSPNERGFYVSLHVCRFDSVSWLRSSRSQTLPKRDVERKLILMLVSRKRKGQSCIWSMHVRQQHLWQTAKLQNLELNQLSASIIAKCRSIGRRTANFPSIFCAGIDTEDQCWCPWLCSWFEAFCISSILTLSLLSSRTTFSQNSEAGEMYKWGSENWQYNHLSSE